MGEWGWDANIDDLDGGQVSSITQIIVCFACQNAGFDDRLSYNFANRFSSVYSC